MDPKKKEEICKSWLNNGDWRIVDDKTIEHNYKGFETPLICSHKNTYFNPDFHEKLIKKCKGRPAHGKEEDVCIQEDNYCSLNEKEECFFDTTKVNEDNRDDRLKIFGVEPEINKSKIYNNKILNNKNEINRITEDNQELLNDIDPKNILSGRGENLKISIVEVNCEQLKSGIGDLLNDEDKDIFDIDYNFDDLNDKDKDIRRRLENHKYNCEKRIIYPEVNFAKYNRDYNNPNLPKAPEIEEEDDKTIQKEREGLEDIQGLQWQPEMYKSLLTELQTNIKFRECIDDKLGIKKLEGYEEFINDVESENFKIEKYIDFIKSACDEFISLPPDKIKECIDKLNYSEVLKNNICEGDITLTMIDSYNLVLEFIGIHIDFKELKQETIIKLTPLIKEVLYKVITTSQYYEQTLCRGKTSNVTKNLKTMYNTLFDTRKSIEYPFKNLDITSDFFNEFTKNIYVKIILLVFVAFIFAKIVDLFSGKDCSQIPVNTK